MTDQIGVIGAGAWGTTLAVLLADAQRPVSLWTHSAESAERLAHERTNERYLPGVVFPPNLRVVTDDAYLAEPHRFFVLAVPSAHLRGTLRRLATTLHPDAALLSVVKGIEEGTHLRMSEVAAQELPGPARRRPVGPEPGARDRRRQAGRIGRGVRGWRAGGGARIGPVVGSVPGLHQSRPRSGWSWRAR